MSELEPGPPPVLRLVAKWVAIAVAFLILLYGIWFAYVMLSIYA